jgi:hypothetical protein
MSKVDFKEHLQRQLRFIERSCESYDKGFEDETVRIATALRVLFHDTSRSISLLKHLGASPNLLTTVRPLVAGAGVIFFDGIGLISVGPEGAIIPPKFGDGSYKGFLRHDEWWHQIICISDQIKITRRDIILTAADKDGGAHVDPKLTAQYEELQAGVWTTASASSCERRIENYQFVFLRQAGYEVLNSPDLVALAC